MNKKILIFLFSVFGLTGVGYCGGVYQGYHTFDSSITAALQENSVIVPSGTAIVDSVTVISTGSGGSFFSQSR